MLRDRERHTERERQRETERDRERALVVVPGGEMDVRDVKLRIEDFMY